MGAPVRDGTRTHSIVEVVGDMFAVNLVVLVPLAGSTAYPQTDSTLMALGAVTAAGVLGSIGTLAG